MPPDGAPSRAEALATLQRHHHELFIDDETGRLLEGAEGETARAVYDSDDACLVRLIRRQWDKARRVPTELAAEIARAASMGQEAWVAARAGLRLRRLRARTWSATSSWRAATSTVMPATTATSAPTTCCSTTTSRR